MTLRARCGATLLAAALYLGPLCVAAARSPLPDQRVDFPTELVGKWGFVVASGNYCDDFAHCAPGAGGSVTFVFEANGRTQYTLFESTLVPGCGQVRTLTRQSGRTRVRDAALVFIPTAGTYRAVNACRPDLTGLWQFSSGDLKAKTLRWRLEGRILHLEDASGEASGNFSRR
jgi:hypothetical protein